MRRRGAGSAGPQNKVVLVRHSLPEVEPTKDPAEWRLSLEGRKRARAPASVLTEKPSIVSSDEPKAIETAAIVGRAVGVVLATHPDLHEHRRTAADWTPGERWQRLMSELFARPSEVVFGLESADQAHARFFAAVDRVMRSCVGDVAIVTHGTVIALYVGRATGIDPYELWARLDLPATVTMSWPDLGLLEIIDSFSIGNPQGCGFRSVGGAVGGRVSDAGGRDSGGGRSPRPWVGGDSRGLTTGLFVRGSRSNFVPSVINRCATPRTMKKMVGGVSSEKPSTNGATINATARTKSNTT